MDAPFSNVRSMLGALAEALNLIDATLENHHQQTAYLSYMLARDLGLPPEDIPLVIHAALIHDIGFLEYDDLPQTLEELESHAGELAARSAHMLEGLPGAEEIAEVIVRCQRSWTYLQREPGCGRSARIAAIIHLADVICTLLRPDVPVLNQVKLLRSVVQKHREGEFSPEASDAFLRVSENEFIWLDLRYHPQFLVFFTGDIMPVSLDKAVEMTAFMSRVIDYRSAFTAMHSAGVSASAEALARLCGMSGREQKMMRIAGHLHDVGKLRIPRAILEKPGKLTEEEFNQIKEHPYYTRLILMNVDGFERIADWAGLHHEKLNGHGYPFHFGASDLDTGSRIMAIADVFSAVTETRPYRPGMDRESALAVLRENVERGGLDGELVTLLHDNYDLVNDARDAASRLEGARYFRSIAAGDEKDR